MPQDIIDLPDLEIFIRDKSDEAERRNFKHIAPIYPFATENIAGYFPLIDFSGKKVLTISGSGDQVLNSIFHGAVRINAFDINQLSSTFTELKMVALEHLLYEDYLRYFISSPGNEDILSMKLYQNFSEFLSPATKYIFNRFYEEYHGDGYKLRKSHIFFNQPPVDHRALVYNSFMQTEQNYLATRQRLKTVPYRWYRSNVTDLVIVLQPSNGYDVILLSNIADYANHMYPGPNHLSDFFRNTVLPLKNYLNTGGIICAACLFRIDDVTPEHAENDLYNTKKRLEVLSDLRLEYRELRFPGAIEGYDDLLLVVY